MSVGRGKGLGPRHRGHSALKYDVKGVAWVCWDAVAVLHISDQHYGHGFGRALEAEVCRVNIYRKLKGEQVVDVGGEPGR